MLRILHCLDNRPTDGCKVVSLTHPPHFTPQKYHYFYVSGTHFCWKLSKPQGLVRPEGLGKLKKKSSHRVPSGLQHSAFTTTHIQGSISLIVGQMPLHHDYCFIRIQIVEFPLLKIYLYDSVARVSFMRTLCRTLSHPFKSHF
jgi:hypothetical protein